MTVFFIAFPYVFLFIILFLLSIPYTAANSLMASAVNIDKLVLSILVIIFFYAFRGLLFSDWVQYYPAFEKIKILGEPNCFRDNFQNVPWEKGFVIYMMLIKSIVPNYYIFQAVDFMIVFISVVCFFRDNLPVKYIPLGCLFFFLFYGEHFSGNFLRNAKALIIFLYSIKYIKKRNLVKYILVNMIGTVFHITAVFFIPFYFIAHMKIRKALLLVFFLAGNIVFLFNISFIKVVLSFFAAYSDSRISTLISFYLERKHYSAAYGFTIGYFERLFTFICLFIYTERLINIRKENIIYINSMYFYLYICLFVSDFYILIERFAILYVFGYWIIYPHLYALLRKRGKYYFLFFLLCYGSLKVFWGHRDITFLYENIFFFPRTFYERTSMLEAWK